MTTTATAMRCLECGGPTDPGNRRCSPCHQQVISERDGVKLKAPPEAPVQDVDWHALMQIAERRRIPVLRIDQLGTPHIVRTVQQLTDEWEN